MSELEKIFADLDLLVEENPELLTHISRIRKNVISLVLEPFNAGDMTGYVDCIIRRAHCEGKDSENNHEIPEEGNKLHAMWIRNELYFNGSEDDDSILADMKKRDDLIADALSSQADADLEYTKQRCFREARIARLLCQQHAAGLLLSDERKREARLASYRARKEQEREQEMKQEQKQKNNRSRRNRR